MDNLSKIRPALILEILYKNTDENHTVTVAPDGRGGNLSMQEYLERELGYRPDVRSIRRDLVLIGKRDPDSFSGGEEKRRSPHPSIVRTPRTPWSVRAAAPPTARTRNSARAAASV